MQAEEVAADRVVGGGIGNGEGGEVDELVHPVGPEGGNSIEHILVAGVLA